MKRFDDYEIDDKIKATTLSVIQMRQRDGNSSGIFKIALASGGFVGANTRFNITSYYRAVNNDELTFGSEGAAVSLMREIQNIIKSNATLTDRTRAGMSEQLRIGRLKQEVAENYGIDQGLIEGSSKEEVLASAKAILAKQAAKLRRIREEQAMIAEATPQTVQEALQLMREEGEAGQKITGLPEQLAGGELPE